MAVKKNSVRTSKTVASSASKALRTSRSTVVKKLAASGLSNRKRTNKR